VFRAALIPILAGVLIAGCGAAPSEPAATAHAVKTATPSRSETTADLQGRLLKDLQRWLTANSPAGVTAKLYEVTCEDVGRDQFKCGARGELVDTQNRSEAGHMTVVVTIKPDGSYTSEVTQPWTGGEF
jgi:hypothetical protein